MKRSTIAAALLVTLALTGCAAQPAPSATPRTLGTVTSIEQVRDAYNLVVGGTCTGKQEDGGYFAAKSITCSQNELILIFDSTSKRDQQLMLYADAAKTIGPLKQLVGDNWILVTPTPERYRSTLGGSVITYQKDA